ncbi:MAG: VOC family protein [Bacteroidota bacterium]
MASVSIYLNFDGHTEEAFNYYKSIFGGEFANLQRFGEMPPQEGMPPLPPDIHHQIMHIHLPILDGFDLMGSDSPEIFGQKVQMGNNFHLNVTLDNREDTKKYFEALKEGGTVTRELADMFWGDYFGSCIDKYGVQWMLSFPARREG